MSEEFLWFQKYRPTVIDDCNLPKKTKEAFKAFVETGDVPNYIFAGPPGIGKTTLATCLGNELGAEILFLNGSGEDRGIDAVKTKIVRFASSMSMGSDTRRLVIFDEADNLTPDSQMALRSVMEQVSKNCGFILTCNYEGRLSEAIHSRCHLVKFGVPTDPGEKKDFAVGFIRRLVEILKSEGVEYDVNVIKKYAKVTFPEMRKAINGLQNYAINGAIDAGILSSVTGSDISELVGYLQSSDWANMRKWVGENADDPAAIILQLFEKGDKIFEGVSYPQACIHLHDHSVDHSRCLDQELNLVACLTKLMVECEFSK